ncbi:hypothetical protein VIGAN_03217800, partial [Vigna angularis var. angularis]
HSLTLSQLKDVPTPPATVNSGKKIKPLPGTKVTLPSLFQYPKLVLINKKRGLYYTNQNFSSYFLSLHCNTNNSSRFYSNQIT